MGGVLVDARSWAGELKALHERFVHRFSRSEPRESTLAYMRGLISPLERKNGWTLAEEAGHTGPDRIHRLLNRIDWDAEEVLDDVRGYVVEHLGDPEAVLIVDDTGFLKKGVRSAGVQRQYSGTAGRTENCQIGVFLAYAASRGRTLIDRRLYLPTSWTDDRDRCRRAGIDDAVGFETVGGRGFLPSQVHANVASCAVATGPGPPDSQPASGQGGLSRVGRRPIAQRRPKGALDWPRCPAPSEIGRPRLSGLHEALFRVGTYPCTSLAAFRCTPTPRLSRSP